MIEDATNLRDEADAAHAECADLRLALLHAESRLHRIGRSEQHERALRLDAEQRLAQLGAVADPRSVLAIAEQHRQHLADGAQRLHALEQTVAVRDAEIGALRLMLAAFEESAIWRATWPLRRTLDSNPGLARGGRKLARAGWWTLTGQWPRRLRERADWRRQVAAQQEAVTLSLAAPAAASDVDLQRDSDVRQGPAPEPVETLVVPTSDQPVVSIIIPCYGQVPVTLRCLRAIAASGTVTPFEVIVAEDASGDPEIGVLEDVIGITLIRNPANLGFLHNCNAAALHARGRYLLFLNNDTEPLPSFLDALVRAIEAIPRAGLVGSKLLFPDGRLQEAGGIIWQDGTGWNYGRGDDPSRPEYNTLRDTDYVSGASLLLRRDLFEALDGFDRTFAPAYYEDTDLAFRIRARGLRVLVQPDSLVVHHEGVSHGTDITSGVKRQQEINRHRFTARWPKLLAREHFPSAEQPIRAAEHARGKPTILVIDHYVPEPDRDAGSRSTMGILHALRDAGWVVRFWPANRAHNRYTVLLETMGITVIDHRSPFGFDSWIERNGQDYDHVLLMRPTVAPEFLTGLMTRTRAKLSFYGHDVHHLRMRRQAALTDDRRLMLEAEIMERRELALWAFFDVVIYPSSVEAALVRDRIPHANAHAIVPYAFDRFPARVLPPDGKSVLFVAGFAHPPNIDAAMWLAKEIMPRLQRIVPDATLVLAGSHPTEAIRALATTGVTVTGSLDDAALDARYRSARVAVVPLRVGAGVKGKVVEALAKGLPLVTTPIGAEGIEGVEQVVPVTDDPDRMAAVLSQLLLDDRQWTAQSARQLAYASRHFSRTAMAKSVLDCLEPSASIRSAAAPVESLQI